MKRFISLAAVVAALVAPLLVLAVDTLNLSGVIISSGQTVTHEVNATIDTSGNVEVQNGGTLNLAAGSRVVLGAGFHACEGSSLTVRVGQQHVDADRDGMPNSWELQHGLDPNDPSDASLDTDNDGLSNFVEFTNGTDPRSYDAPSSTAPVPTITIDGVEPGAVLTRPYGGALLLTVRYKAADTNGDLAGIRPQVWHPDTDLDAYYEDIYDDWGNIIGSQYINPDDSYSENNSGQLVGQYGSHGEVIRKVLVNLDGDWYFWTDSVDHAGQFRSTPSQTSGFKVTINQGPASANRLPIASVEVDGKSSGATVVRPYGKPVSITVRYKAHDDDGNLSAMRPQLWHEGTNSLTNDGGMLTGVSGIDAEIVRTYTLDKNGDWYVWTDAWDNVSPGLVNNGAYQNGFRINVVEAAEIPNQVPAPAVVCDQFASGATVRLPNGQPVTVTLRYLASDADGNLTGIRPHVWHKPREYWNDYEQRYEPDPSDEYYDDNGGQMVAAPGSRGEVVRQVTLNNTGEWFFWTHAQDVVSASSYTSSGDRDSGFKLNVEWGTGGTSTPSAVTLGGLPATIKIGESLALTSTASSPSENLAGHSFWKRGPRTDDSFAQGEQDWVQDVADRNGWSNQPNPGVPSGAQYSAISATFIPSTTGYWQFQANASTIDGAFGPRATSGTIFVAPKPTVTIMATGSGTAAASGGGVLTVPTGETITVTSEAGATGWLSAHGVHGYSGTTSASAGFSLIADEMSPMPGAASHTITTQWTPSAPGTYTLYAESFTGRTKGERANGTSGYPGSFDGLAANRVTIIVLPINNAQFLSHSVPASLATGEQKTVSLTFKNVGNLSWTSGVYSLVNKNPQNSSVWGLAKVDVGGIIESGNEKTFTFTITAPSTPGTYDFQWTMQQDGVESFGEPSALVSIRVQPTLVDDTDNDGIPNTWELQYGLNPNSAADALLDSDGDGLTNITEYNLETDPTHYNTAPGMSGNAEPAGWISLIAADTSRSDAVGLTPGQFAVDKSGAATYSVALAPTPGTAGMEPKLSLNYSSQAGAGIAGFGWSLGGISAISRTPTNRLIDDGIIDGVDFDDNDKFSLDGQRLILVSGSYGQDGAEYRTELESFSRIVSYGRFGNGPAWFKVWTKAGLIVEFGHTEDSSFDVSGSGLSREIMAWQVNRISDTSGNYMTFHYAGDGAQGISYLERINYTGNSNTGSWPYASVRFEYEDRPDPSRGFVAGRAYAATKRLTKVGSYFGNTAVRSYTLGYTSTETGRSILSKLTETGRDGKSYPPLVFEYSNPTAGWNYADRTKWAPPVQIAGADAHGQRPSRGTGFIDLDGDGLPDFVQYYDGYTPDWSGYNQRNIHTIYRRAWRNDPVRGWVEAHGQNGEDDWRLPEGFVIAHDYNSESDTRFADINGDGLIDVINKFGKVRLNTGHGFETSDSPAWQIPLPPDAPVGSECSYPTSFYCVDINGDGLVDYVSGSLLFFHTETDSEGNSTTIDDGYRPNVWLNQGPNAATKWVYAADYVLPDAFISDQGVRLLDLNSDGLPDLVRYWYDGAYSSTGPTTRAVALNTGHGWNQLTENSADFNRFVPPELLTIAKYITQYEYQRNATVGTELVDINNDGLVDLVRRYDDYPFQKNAVYYNTGNGWLAAPETFRVPIATAFGFRPYGSAFLDINNDGILDYVHGWGNNRATYLGSSATGWGADASSYHLVRQFADYNLSAVGSDMIDLNADGAIDQIWHWNDKGAVTRDAVLNRRANPSRLVKVTTGLGVSTSIEYAPLTQRDPTTGAPTVYQKGTGATFPKVDVIAPLYVVKTVSNDDGTGGQYDIEYFYKGLRTDAERGSLGFEEMTVVDTRTEISTTTTFRQDYPYIGLTSTTVTKKLGASTSLSTSSTAYDQKLLNSDKTRFIFAKSSEQRTYELDGTLTSSISTVTQRDGHVDYDDYGNSLYVSVSSSDGYRKTTVNAYDNFDQSGKWILGRLRTAVATAEAPGVPTQTRESAFEYDSTTGLLTKEVVEPNHANDPENFTLTTTYQYDEYGNKKSSTITGGGLGAAGRTTTTSYNPADAGQTGPAGRFPYKTTNALGHFETYAYDDALGVPLSLTGPNNLTTSWIYDGFARKLKETRPDTTVTETSYRWTLANSAVTGACFHVVTVSSGSTPSVVFLDSFGRKIASYGFNGGGLDGNVRIVGALTQYDSMGRAYRTSIPFYLNTQPAGWVTTTRYDDLNRPLEVSAPNDEVIGGLVHSSVAYEGLVTKSTNPKGQIEYVRKNTQGQVVERINNYTAATNSVERGRITYLYDAYGQLLTTTVYKEDGTSVATSIVYDLRGRKKTMVDPDMGTWDYAYNAAGELTLQTDAKDQTTSMTYDALGRLKTRTEAEGVTTWTYDEAPRGSSVWLGKLYSVQSPSSGSKIYKETYSYDALGRPDTVTRNIDGFDYSIGQTYDAYSRPEKTTYPGGYRVGNRYNSFGFLTEVYDARTTTNVLQGDTPAGYVYWRAEGYALNGAVNASMLGNGVTLDRVYSDVTGRLAAISSGNGYSTEVQNIILAHDALGNVTRRIDSSTGRDESFLYDGLNRLKRSEVRGGPATDVTYDALGNIKTKSDIGTYHYDGSRPHAVSSISGGPLGDRWYTYDYGRTENGNLTSDGDRSISYTSYDQVKTVTKAGRKTEFWFGAGHERIMQVDDGGSTTTYVGSLFEIVKTGDLTEKKHYIYTPVGRVAVRTTRVQGGSGTTYETRFLHQDVLGSVTTVTDEFGRIEQRFAFDAWGQRTKDLNTRLDANGNPRTPALAGGAVTRGFTDHEHLDAFGLIHMNGRVYDPILGRFISADPFVQGLGDSQAYNRYSYVSNDPINATDPSGYFSFRDFHMLSHYTHPGYWLARKQYIQYEPSIRGAVVTAVMLICTKGGAGPWAAAVGGAVSAFESSLLNGGSVSDAYKAGAVGGLIGFATGALSQGICGAFGPAWSNGWAGELGRAAAHGVVGGFMAEVQGGEFRHGFYGSFAGSLGGSLTPKALGKPGDWRNPSLVAARTTWAAVIGGTASAVGGGKFANGAMTAAFQHLLNAETAPRRKSVAIFITDEMEDRMIELDDGKKVSPLRYLSARFAEYSDESVDFDVIKVSSIETVKTYVEAKRYDIIHVWGHGNAYGMRFRVGEDITLDIELSDRESARGFSRAEIASPIQNLGALAALSRDQYKTPFYTYHCRSLIGTGGEEIIANIRRRSK